MEQKNNSKGPASIQNVKKMACELIGACENWEMTGSMNEEDKQEVKIDEIIKSLSELKKEWSK